MRTSTASRKKIGGIVVNTITTPSGSGKKILIGCGLDVRNNGPLCSLSRLAGTELSMERVLADIMVRFSVYWNEFLTVDGSFAGFEERYKRVWLHSGWYGWIRLRSDGEKTRCTLLGLDASGGLQVQQFREQEGRRLTRDVTVSLDQFSLDFQRSLIYPKAH